MPGSVNRIPTVVIGAGHSGLAVSNLLTRGGVDHVVLERGEVANTWRTERWDSLRLLTPNWQTAASRPVLRRSRSRWLHDRRRGRRVHRRLTPPGFGAPVETGTTVARTDQGRRPLSGRHRPGSMGDGVGRDRQWRIQPPQGARPSARDLPATVTSITAFDYKRPDQLGTGGVLVVGASATGIQIADELRKSGRDGHSGRGGAREDASHLSRS